MTSKIIITKLHMPLPSGEVAGADASITTAKGQSFSWSGKLSDGEAYMGGEIQEGDHVIASNSTGLFAWTLLSDPPKEKATAPKAIKKTEASGHEPGSVRKARQARAANKP